MKSIILNIFLLTIFTIVTSCAGKKNVIEVRPTLYPSPVALEGYITNNKDSAMYIADDYKVQIKLVKNSELPKNNLLITRLMEKEYFFVELTLISINGKIIYKPSFTRIRTDAGDSLKPMDYTDLYDFEQFNFTGVPGEVGLRDLRGKYFDNEVTIYPGNSVKRLLIFKPIDFDAKSAKFSINEMYYGTKNYGDTVAELIFPLITK